MKAELMQEHKDKTFVLIFDKGDEVMQTLTDFARKKGLDSSNFTAIGAFSDVTLGVLDWETKKFNPIKFEEQLEVLALTGDIALQDGQPKVHAHVVLSRHDGRAYGGHLLEAHVRPTLEVVLTESSRHLQRQYDPESGLFLIKL